LPNGRSWGEDVTIAAWLSEPEVRAAQSLEDRESGEGVSGPRVRDGSGRIDGVRYDELAPMLLNEMQLQQTAIAAQLRATCSSCLRS
jgi:hypothetical protein